MSKTVGFKIANIDLTTRTIRSEIADGKDFRMFLGGRGLAAKILFEGQRGGVDPLGPENQLIFATGKLVGTPVPTAGQVTITAKSPATGFYFKSNTGGMWAKNLRRAGWDVVVVTGISESPVYIVIDDDRITFRDASTIWGRGVRTSNGEILSQLGGKGWDLATIGQAGENLVNFACIMTSFYHAAGRGGLGAVMGRKKLKSIAVRGSGTTEVADVSLLETEIQSVLAKAKKSVKAGLLLQFGTAATIEMANEGGSLPVNNFSSAQIPGGHKLGGTYLLQKGHMRQGSACSACLMGCHKHALVRTGKYKGHSGGPEYETLAALGTSCGIIDPEAVLKANELCNDYGLDTISTGGVIGWLFESASRGVIPKEECGDLRLDWGSAEAMVELVNLIAKREGVGNLLAKGCLLASKEVGGESWKWAVQANGLEQSRVDTRVAKAYALSFAVNPRGPDHLYAQPQAEFGRTPEARQLMERLMGSDKYCNSKIVDGKPELVRWHEDMFAVTDALGICSFATTTTYIIDESSLARFIMAVLGISMEEEEIMRTGRRTVVLERCFNLREDPNRKDTLPWRLMNEPVAKGPYKGMINSEQEMRTLIDKYYSLHGYDPVSGKPTKEVLSSLGLLDVVKGSEEMIL
jgi:aldehyde:ferredoxin oxidoreductase